ncbi:MAG: cell division protein FtsA [Candidatus Yanofskybacteria bacterium]|nr:cell division protein FtsA [Candidatus Yanofskybacteria bacterium]
MARTHTISGIDIGNSHIKVVTASISRESAKPEIIGAGSSPSKGLRKGMVVDMEETMENVRSAVQQAEAMSGVPIKRAYLSISGLHIKSQLSRGVIAVSRADNEISQGDIDRVLQAASIVSLPANREIIHIVPRGYVIDGTEHVKNPLGMKGVRLEAEVLIIDGLAPYVRNIIKCIEENRVEVAGLVYAPLAAALASLDKTQKEYGVMNLDFGGATSTVTVFEETDLLHSAVLPVGSRHITNDLAIALRTSIETAEKIKLEHAATSEGEDMRRKENIDLSAYIGEEGFVLPKRQLMRVVDARLEELLDLVRAELKKISRDGLLPAGIVLSGGGANLPGLATLVKENLRLPVRIAKPIHVDGIIDVVADPSYAVSIGLVLWGVDQELSGTRSSSATFSGSGNFIQKMFDWLKNFLP